MAYKGLRTPIRRHMQTGECVNNAEKLFGSTEDARVFVRPKRRLNGRLGKTFYERMLHVSVARDRAADLAVGFVGGDEDVVFEFQAKGLQVHGDAMLVRHGD